MAKYIKCPRCELNFIIEGKQDYCDVCVAEMKGSRLQFADLEDEELEAELESEAAIREAGRMRMEGKEYVVQDGDVMHFRFNV